MARVIVQRDGFDIAAEIARMAAESGSDVGAIVTFTGLCRAEKGALAALELEHYPGMAEAEMERIARKAEERWPIDALTLIHRYMRPLLDAGRVFAAVPPLHRLEIINAGSKANEVIYTYSDAEMKSLLIDADKRGKRVKDPVQRYKGLGEMDASQLRETTMDPAHRTLRRISVTDAQAAEEVFDLLMGNDVAPRKEFIVDGAAGLDRDRIDA